MSWLSKIFSSVGVNVISSVGKVIDDLVTSDEEMELTDIQKKKITAAYNVKMQELLNQLDHQAAQHEENLESELTQRLKLDMKSDSWLSKNIRPMTLIFMTLVVSVLAFFTIFTSSFSADQLDTIKEWIPFFEWSSGMKKVLLIITDILTLPDNSFYTIDEYENSLGQNAIGFLPDFIDSYGGNTQFFITSHHPVLISNMPMENWYVLNREGSRVRIKRGDKYIDKFGISKQSAFTQLTNDPFFIDGIK